MRPSSHPHASTRLQQSLPVLLSSGRLSAPGRNCCDVTQTCRPMPPGFEPLPFGNSSAESQRDSGSKPRVASRELPWEMRVVSANPNGVVARWWSGDATPLGLKIARTLTQGSLADSATLGWRTQSLWDLLVCPGNKSWRHWTASLRCDAAAPNTPLDLCPDVLSLAGGRRS